jgi:hypothetical protein
MIAYWID